MAGVSVTFYTRLDLGMFAVQCGAVLDPFQHCTLRCGLAKTITASNFVFVVTCAVRCGVVQSLAKTITVPHLIFAVTCVILCIRCGLKSVYFSNFGLFLLSPKLIFPIFWAKFLGVSIWVSVSGSCHVEVRVFD